MNNNETLQTITEDEQEMMRFLKTAPCPDDAPPPELDAAVRAAAVQHLRRPKMIALFYASAASLAAMTALCCGLFLHQPEITETVQTVRTDQAWDWTELESELISFSGEVENMNENSSWELTYNSNYGGFLL